MAISKTQRTRSQLFEWCEETAGQGQSLAWVTDQPLPELLVETACKQLSLAPESVDDTTDQEPEKISHERVTGELALRAWAETMASTVQSDRKDAPRIPVAVAQKPPMSSQAAMLIACSLGLLVALGCFVLHSTASQQLADLNAQIDVFNRTKKALATDKQNLQKLSKELADKQQALDELKDGNRKLSTSLAQAAQMRHFQQTRWLELVSALSRANEGDCWISGLETHGKVVTVQGLAISNQEISVFATNLEKYASPHGWRVHPAQTERNEMALIEFEVSLDVSDRDVPDPSVGSSVVRSSLPLSFASASTQSLRPNVLSRSPAKPGENQ